MAFLSGLMKGVMAKALEEDEVEGVVGVLAVEDFPQDEEVATLGQWVQRKENAAYAIKKVSRFVDVE